MHCRIADVIVDVPTVGDLVPRCQDYIVMNECKANIVIDPKEFDINRWSELSLNATIYLQSGFQFYKKLLDYNGLMLHASAIEMDGKAYLFSGPCGTGKSTHTKLWLDIFGEKAHIINDDKPALRYMDAKWYTYGTPWCGKDGINLNKKVPLAGVCFLKQGLENRMTRLTAKESIRRILSQTSHRFDDVSRLNLKLSLIDQLVREIPIYELVNKPEPEAAILSYETMRKGAEEAGL